MSIKNPADYSMDLLIGAAFVMRSGDPFIVVKESKRTSQGQRIVRSVIVRCCTCGTHQRKCVGPLVNRDASCHRCDGVRDSDLNP